MYTEYYNLTRKPFENTPDPDFLFLSGMHREVLASLVYGVNAGKGFILVAGDIGTGKTTLIHALLQEIDSRFLILHIINPRYAFSEILRHLARKLGLDSKEKTNMELTEDVSKRLESLDKAGKRTVIIIDEAHHLSEESLEEIRLISNIETEKRKLIQIVLVGQLELYRKLQKDSLRQLKQRVVLNRSLKPLDKKETTDYISHRLRIAGRIVPLYDRKALSLIWKKSRGIPRVINQLCDNALIIGFASEAPVIGSKILKEVINDMESGREYLRGAGSSFHHRFKWYFSAVSITLTAIFLGVYFTGDSFYQKGGRDRVSVNQKISRQGDFHEKSQLKHEESQLKLARGKVAADALLNRNEKTITIGDKFKAYSSNPVVIRIQGNLQSEESLAEKPLLSRPRNTIDIKRDARWSTKRIVKPNEHLLEIARKAYRVSSDTIIDLIQMANPGLKNVNLIYPNQKITLPNIERRTLIVKDEEDGYYIHYASFYEFKVAQKAIEDFIDSKQQGFLVIAIQGDNLVYRIYFGKFKSYNEAERNLKTLNLKYLSFLNDENYNRYDNI